MNLRISCCFLVSLLCLLCLPGIKADDDDDDDDDDDESSSSKSKIERCTSRFDIIDELESLHDSHNYSMCNKYLTYGTCLSTVSLVFFDIPPYIYVNKDGEVDGIMPCKYT